MNQLNQWIELNGKGFNTPPKIVESAVFVNDTLELAQRICHDLDLSGDYAIFEVYDRLIHQLIKPTPVNSSD
jgi:hypothetical protein